MEVLVPKKTGTYADALCAVGYASLLTELRGTEARIEDIGHSYRVSSLHGIAPDDWKPPSPGFLYIWRKSKEDKPAPVGPVMDYEAEKVLADAAKKSNSSARAEKQVAEALGETSDAPTAAISPEYRFAAIIEWMRKGWVSDKSLYRWIAENGTQCLSAVRSRLQGESCKFKPKWSNSQILNPSTGKGVHASKTVSKSASRFGLFDTFDEWMKQRGLWVAMLGFRSDEDFKLFVLDPADISSTALEKLRIELRDLGMWGVVRLDIEATLRLLQSLMLHSEVRERGGIPLLKKRPNSVVRGLRLAFFKSLGNAAALMNDSLLPLPGWFVVEGPKDVDDYLTICQEPYGAAKKEYGPLSALRNDRPDEVELLQKYRRWLTSGELGDLLEFHASFAPVLLRRIAANDFAPAFHRKHRRQPDGSANRRIAANDFAPAFQASVLHILLSKGYPDVKDIIESPGFQNVARAIRNTTIYAACMKNSNREIRFGLAQNLKQRIKAGDKEFLAALADFVQQQNWEVVHKLKGVGFQVSTTDLDEIVRLTAEHGAELVGMLLLAYGFSRAEAIGSVYEQSPGASA